MATVYYSYPRKAGVSKKHSTVRRSSKTLGCRTAPAMEQILQHAYVAHLEETLFCPSNPGSLISAFALESILTTSLRNGPSVDTTITSEDAASGVPLRSEELESVWPDSQNSLTRLPASRSGVNSNLTSTSEEFLHDHGERAPPWRAQILHFGQHGSDADLQETDLRTPDGRGTVPSLLGGDVVTLVYHPAAEPSIEEPVSVDQRQLPSELDQSLHPRSPALPLDARDDSVALDAYSRDSDFLQFLTQWLRGNGDIPALETSEHSQIPLNMPNVQWTRGEARERGVDDQGLRWQGSGCDRNEALAARRLLHSKRQSPARYISGPPACNTDSADTQRYYRFRSYDTRHRAKPSHYQLRHMLASTNRSNIFYAAGDKVMRTSLACMNLCEPVMDHSRSVVSASSFRITCLAASPTLKWGSESGDGLVFAGGFDGQYTFSNLTENTPISNGWVSHAYNAVVTHIDTSYDRRSGLLRAAFSSNDRALRVMDVNTARFVGVHAFDHSINCSAMSADGRFRVVVGDTHDTLITDADRGDLLVSLSGHGDCVFACACSGDGRFVATAAEDAKVIVWDARNWTRPLVTMSCFGSSTRSLQFCDDDGTLVAAEDDDVVCIYEPQHFRLKQTIRFFGSVAGVTLIDGGQEIVIANADRTIGGLMSMQRAPQGRNGGTYREEYCDGQWSRQRRIHRRHSEDVEMVI